MLWDVKQRLWPLLARASSCPPHFHCSHQKCVQKLPAALGPVFPIESRCSSVHLHTYAGMSQEAGHSAETILKILSCRSWGRGTYQILYKDPPDCLEFFSVLISSKVARKKGIESNSLLGNLGKKKSACSLQLKMAVLCVVM